MSPALIYTRSDLKWLKKRVRLKEKKSILHKSKQILYHNEK